MMFAQRLKELRRERGLTQVQLAEQMGVSKGAVAMWEIGEREPNFETIAKLSQLFDRRIDYILGWSNDASSMTAMKDVIDQSHCKYGRMSENHPDLASAFGSLKQRVDTVLTLAKTLSANVDRLLTGEK